jgi:hypothetical protein
VRILVGLMVLVSMNAASASALAQHASKAAAAPRASSSGRSAGRSNSGAAIDNPAYNFTNSREWRQAGGNYGIYLRIMEQKAMVAQGKAMDKEYKLYQKQFLAAQKQQIAFEKWSNDQKAKKEKGKPVDPAYQKMIDEEARYTAAEKVRVANVAAKKAKKKPKTAAPTVEETTEPVVEKPDVPSE